MTLSKHYIVKAKCGHVGKNYYILCDFAVCASSKKEASSIARFIPRVKHNHKDAIRGVREVSFEEYLRLLEDNKRNPYLTSQCRQEQRAFSYIEDNKIKEEDDEIELTNKKLIPFKLKRYKEQIKMCSFSY